MNWSFNYYFYTITLIFVNKNSLENTCLIEGPESFLSLRSTPDCPCPDNLDPAGHARGPPEADKQVNGPAPPFLPPFLSCRRTDPVLWRAKRAGQAVRPVLHYRTRTYEKKLPSLSSYLHTITCFNVFNFRLNILACQAVSVDRC